MLAPTLARASMPWHWAHPGMLALAGGRVAVPAAGGTHEESQQVVDEVGEEHSRDGAAWDGVAWALQVPCGQKQAALVPTGTAPPCSPPASAPAPGATQPSTPCPYLTCWSLP